MNRQTRVLAILLIILAFLPVRADAAKNVSRRQGGFLTFTVRTVGTIYGGAGGDVVVSVGTLTQGKTTRTVVQISYANAIGTMTLQETAEAIKALDVMRAAVNKHTTGERVMEFSTGRGLSFGVRQSGDERDMFINIRGLRRCVSLPVSELEALKKLLQTAIQNRR